MKNEVFEKLPVPKAIIKLAVPTMVGMLVTIIYNLADTFFVGQLNDANQVAAVTITMPVFMALMALGAIFGMGGGSYISRLLGAGEGDKAKHVSALSFYMGIILGVVCIVLGLLFMDPLVGILGSSNMTEGFAKSYLQIIIAGGPFVVLSFSLGQIVRSEGAAKKAMNGMMLGTIINIVLDPILILWLHWGVAGAALATVIANIMSVIYYIVYFKSKGTILSISLKDCHFKADMFAQIFKIGIPASLNNFLMTFSGIVLNNLAVSYSDNVVAALGIVSRSTMLPVMLLIGLCQGVVPLIGYNFASGNHKRLIEVMKFTAISGTVIAMAFSVVMFIGSDFIVGAFIQDRAVVDIGGQFLKINLLSVPFLGIMFLFSTTFQAMGKAIPSLILSICRQGLIFIPVLLIGNALIGVDGLVFAQPVADIASTVLALVLFLRIAKEFKGRESTHETNQNRQDLIS
jgi:putative MATE family efflux protein